MPDNEETLDDLLGGKLKIFQKRRGYRFSLDSILLAHFVRLGKGQRFVELGLGSGVVSLILCYRTGCTAAGVELQEQLAEMAARSFRLNSLEGSMEIVRGDVRDIRKFFEPESFDAAVLNPPYRRAGSGRVSAHPEKALARHEINGSLADFVAAAAYLVRRTGAVFAVYPATRAVELLCLLRKLDVEPKRVRIVHSDGLSAAEFILVEAVRGGGEELEIMPPLYIYDVPGGESDKAGRYTREMRDIFSELCLRQASCGE